jgi:hypothetical protein
VWQQALGQAYLRNEAYEGVLVESFAVLRAHQHGISWLVRDVISFFKFVPQDRALCHIRIKNGKNVLCKTQMEG